ncbi:GNAT family N-acetyltransferase [Methylobacterium persicinum]
MSGSDAPGLVALLEAPEGRRIEPADMAARVDALVQAGGSILVAVEWGPPSGVIAVQPLHDLAAPRPAGLIVALAVSEDARRRGIGRLLVKAAARSARLAGCDRLLLFAHDASDGLADFAAAAGFLPEGPYLVRPLLRRGLRRIEWVGWPEVFHRSRPVPGWCRSDSQQLKGRFTPPG